MRLGHYLFLAAVGMSATSAAESAAQAATTVQVELHDPSSDASLKGMQMKLDRPSAVAGKVTFRVENKSAALVHEMIVIKGDQPVSALPYDAKKDLVDEDKIKSLGEVSELPPGKSGSLTINMKPGSYLLFCNQAGHLHGGMWSKFEVTAH